MFGRVKNTPLRNRVIGMKLSQQLPMMINFYNILLKLKIFIRCVRLFKKAATNKNFIYQSGWNADLQTLDYKP